MRPIRPLALLLAAGLLVVGCSENDSEPTTTAPPMTTTSTTVASTSTTSATTTTSTTTTTGAAPETTIDPLARPDVLVSNPNRDSIDDFDTTGDDLYRIIVEVFDLFSYLEANPTDSALEMVNLIATPDYPYFDTMLEGFLELEENPGWHYVDPGNEILAVDVIETTEDTFTAQIVSQRVQQQIADQTGRVVRTYPASVLRSTTVIFARSSAGLWRLADIMPSQAISRDEIAELVPVEWEGRTG